MVVIAGHFQLEFHDDSIQNFPYGIATAEEKSVRERQAANSHQSLDIYTVPPHSTEYPRNVTHCQPLLKLQYCTNKEWHYEVYTKYHSSVYPHAICHLCLHHGRVHDVTNDPQAVDMELKLNYDRNTIQSASI